MRNPIVRSLLVLPAVLGVLAIVLGRFGMLGDPSRNGMTLGFAAMLAVLFFYMALSLWATAVRQRKLKSDDLNNG
jgi:hypothetical protein